MAIFQKTGTGREVKWTFGRHSRSGALQWALYMLLCRRGVAVCSSRLWVYSIPTVSLFVVLLHKESGIRYLNLGLLLGFTVLVR